MNEWMNGGWFCKTTERLVCCNHPHGAPTGWFGWDAFASIFVHLWIWRFPRGQWSPAFPSNNPCSRYLTTATTEDPAKVFTTRRAPHADHRILAVVLCRRVTLCCVFVLYCVVYLCCTAVLCICVILCCVFVLYCCVVFHSGFHPPVRCHSTVNSIAPHSEPHWPLSDVCLARSGTSAPNVGPCHRSIFPQWSNKSKSARFSWWRFATYSALESPKEYLGHLFYVLAESSNLIE